DRLARWQQTNFGEDLLGLDMTGLGQVYLLAFFVDPEIAFGFGLLRTWLLRHAREACRHLVHAHIQLGVVIGLTGDDQWRTRFVDQNGVHFVDDGISEAALAAVFGAILHVVAQIVETVLVIGTVGDIGRISGL